MEGWTEYVQNLYVTGEYLAKHPSLHEEDSAWKVSKIIPLADMFLGRSNKDEISLLDVGGGAGLILKATSAHIEENYGIRVNRSALDLSPDMLEIQKERNPGLRALNEDVCDSSLGDKEIDLTLMIDLLEHLPNPTRALQEVKRISDYVILKVPMEDNLLFELLDLLRRGGQRRRAIEDYGHIQAYRFTTLRRELEEHTGHVLHHRFTNVFEYIRNSEHSGGEMGITRRFQNALAAQLFKFSPSLCSLLFGDYVMILVECYRV